MGKASPQVGTIAKYMATLGYGLILSPHNLGNAAHPPQKKKNGVCLLGACGSSSLAEQDFYSQLCSSPILGLA